MFDLVAHPVSESGCGGSRRADSPARPDCAERRRPARALPTRPRTQRRAVIDPSCAADCFAGLPEHPRTRCEEMTTRSEKIFRQTGCASSTRGGGSNWWRFTFPFASHGVATKIAPWSAGSPFPGSSLARFWDGSRPPAPALRASSDPALAEVVPNDPSNLASSGLPRRAWPILAGTATGSSTVEPNAGPFDPPSRRIAARA
jgi:hypothetical protein